MAAAEAFDSVVGDAPPAPLQRSNAHHALLGARASLPDRYDKQHVKLPRRNIASFLCLTRKNKPTAGSALPSPLPLIVFALETSHPTLTMLPPILEELVLLENTDPRHEPEWHQ